MMASEYNADMLKPFLRLIYSFTFTFNKFNKSLIRNKHEVQMYIILKADRSNNKRNINKTKSL